MNTIDKDLLKINTYLELDREVVGIKFLFTKKDFDDFKSKELRNKMAYCTMVRNAMRGDKIKATVNNFACLSSAKAVGLLSTNASDDSGKRRLEMGTYSNLCVSRSVSKDMVYCQQEIYGVGIMPLKEYEIEPDVVIIVTNPFNIMRLVQGYAYYNGQLKDVKVAGMQAICQECTSYPFETNDVNISMLCAGTRLLAQWKESEMGMGMPFHKFSQIVDGLEKTINPIERNKRKKEIEGKMKENKIEDFEVIYNKNYDDGCYGGLE